VIDRTLALLPAKPARAEPSLASRDSRARQGEWGCLTGPHHVFLAFALSSLVTTGPLLLSTQVQKALAKSPSSSCQLPVTRGHGRTDPAPRLLRSWTHVPGHEGPSPQLPPSRAASPPLRAGFAHPAHAGRSHAGLRGVRADHAPIASALPVPGEERFCSPLPGDGWHVAVRPLSPGHAQEVGCEHRRCLMVSCSTGCYMDSP